MSAEGVRPGVTSFVARGRPWIRWWNAKRQEKKIKMIKPIATIYMKHHETIWTYLDGLELGTSWNILEHLGTSWNLRLTLLSESFFNIPRFRVAGSLQWVFLLSVCFSGTAVLGSPQQNHHLGVVEEDGQALHRFCNAELWRCSLADVHYMCTDVPVVGPFGTRQHSRPGVIL